MSHARAVIAAWVKDYSEERPHSVLCSATPKDFAKSTVTATVNRAAMLESPTRLMLAQPTPKGLSTKRVLVTNG